MTVWDLSHSVGALAVDLDAWNADLAVGCTYTYTNGGPGAPAFLYLASRWHGQIEMPVRGWFGHARPFAFDRSYEPAAGAQRFLDATPPVLSMAALETALEVFDGVAPAMLEARAGELTDLFIALVDARVGSGSRRCTSPGWRWSTPSDTSLTCWRPATGTVPSSDAHEGSAEEDHRDPSPVRTGRSSDPRWHRSGPRADRGRRWVPRRRGSTP